MGAWLWWAWLQVWPNLAANVVWVPLAWAHHVLMRRHTARQLAEHAAQQHEHITAAISAAREG